MRGTKLDHGVLAVWRSCFERPTGDLYEQRYRGWVTAKLCMFAVGLAWTIPHGSWSSEVSRDLLFHALDDSSELVPLAVVAILEFVSAYRSKLLSTAPQPQKIAHLRGSLGQMEKGAWRLDPHPWLVFYCRQKRPAATCASLGAFMLPRAPRELAFERKAARRDPGYVCVTILNLNGGKQGQYSTID